MSWHGTVTCSYCYERGHTRRKCPTMKKYHDQYENASEEERSNLGWRERNAHQEWRRQRETLNESNKVCNFCQETGHRVLTCPERLGRVEQLRKINKVYKPLLRKTLKEIGFGKGCLISLHQWVTVNGEHEKREVPYMVTGVEEGALDFCNLREGFGQITVTSMIDMRETTAYMPCDVQWAIVQAVCHVEGYEWGETNWCEVARAHPFQREIRGIQPPQNPTILAPSDDTFCVDSLCYPLEKKRDINRMFREEKNRKDRGRFYTDEYTHRFVGSMFAKLKEHQGWKL